MPHIIILVSCIRAYIYEFMNISSIFVFSYPAKNFGEHGAAKHPRRSDLYVLVHGRMWLTLWLGKTITHIIENYYIYFITREFFITSTTIISKHGLDLNSDAIAPHCTDVHLFNIIYIIQYRNLNLSKQKRRSRLVIMRSFIELSFFFSL